jgi:hypothetical protein
MHDQQETHALLNKARLQQAAELLASGSYKAFTKS